MHGMQTCIHKHVLQLSKEIYCRIIQQMTFHYCYYFLKDGRKSSPLKLLDLMIYCSEDEQQHDRSSNLGY